MNFSGTIDKNGYLHIKTPETWLKIPSLAGKWVSVSITTFKKRSSDQNRYYWGCVIPIFRDIYKNLGYDITDDETHDTLAKRLLGEIDMINADGEVVGRKTRSTTTLTTKEFTEYCEAAQRYAAQHFSVYIPDPNEQTTLNNI